VCDECGKEQAMARTEEGHPKDPVNPETGERWWARMDRDAEVPTMRHACSQKCRDKDGVKTLPEQA